VNSRLLADTSASTWRTVVNASARNRLLADAELSALRSLPGHGERAALVAAKKPICLRTRHGFAQSAVQSISGGLLDSRRTFAHRIVA
jgi:hypothetical protein